VAPSSIKRFNFSLIFTTEGRGTITTFTVPLCFCYTGTSTVSPASFSRTFEMSYITPIVQVWSLLLLLFCFVLFQHNEELHDLYSSPSIIRIIKSRRMRWAGHVERMGEKGRCIGYW
jgi:hypothetical protein